MIHLQCPHCARVFTMPDGPAGRTGQCPGCRRRIPVPPKAASVAPVISPELLVVPPSPAQADWADASQEKQNESVAVISDPLDRRLLDLPPAGTGDARLSDEEVLAKLRFKPPPEYTGVRQLPWFIDILLYPANVAGLTALAIAIGVPLLLTLLEQAVFLPFLGLMFLLAKLAVAIYAAWYWAECVADSAKGGTRAPQILDAAGYGDKWSRVCCLLAAYLVFVLPAVVYLLYDGRNLVVAGILLAWALVFFPMGLLAVVLHEALYVLHPLFLLGAIFRTLLPYVGLLSLIAAVAALFWLIVSRLVQEISSTGLAGLGLFLAGYLSLIAAHILGRFYWRYRERLGWDL